MKTKETKIRNEKHLAVLGTNFVANTMGGKKTYRKGHLALTRGLYENNGEYHVEGHGIGHIIPRELFTKFIKTWDEVTTATNKNVKVVKTVHHKVDETKDILAWWNKLDVKNNKKN